MTGVLLTRSEEENRANASRLEAINFKVYHAPMLKYKDLPISPDIYDNIVITSKHAAKLISNLVKYHATCFVVGEESAKILRTNPYLTVQFVANSVAQLISAINSVKGSFVYFSGDIISTEVPSFIKREIIYEVIYAHEILEETKLAIKNQKIKYVMVYSKNCAINLIKLLSDENLLLYLKPSVVIAISEEVASLFERRAAKLIYSEAPSFDRMIELLVQNERKA